MNRYKRLWQENVVFLADIITIVSSYIGAYVLRFEGFPKGEYLSLMFHSVIWVVLIKMICLIGFNVHRSIWRYASEKDITQIIKAATLGSLAVFVFFKFYYGDDGPRSIFIIDWFLLVFGLGGTRFFIKVTRSYRWNCNKHSKKVLIVGAGDAGEIILREILHNKINYKVVGFIDDDPKKMKKRIHGIPVLGSRLKISEIVKNKCVQEIIIAISSLKTKDLREIVDCCIKSGVAYRKVPDMSDLVDGTVKVSEIREIKLEDLLKRDEIILNKEKILNYLKGKKILVTGAGGSIGSELCRQISKFKPEKLILFDNAESSLFYINLELNEKVKLLKKEVVVGDICDKDRVYSVFSEYRPDIVFHAAAYKHVVLMENNVREAVKNNVLGTKIIAEAAISFEAERFIMLSTDKAVDPVSVMGITKKIAEKYINFLSKNNKIKFRAVRFGNVLGSVGSVVPLFKKQIEKGGPITITHPDVKRYFMTIPEAVGLVLEAGCVEAKGDIFILDMGKQIKIFDLAMDLIKLSGKNFEDIKIIYTGLKSGEKLEERLISFEEKVAKTSNDKIMFIISDNKLEDIQEQVAYLEKNINNKEALAEIIKNIFKKEPTVNV